MPSHKKNSGIKLYSDATLTQGAWVRCQGASKNFSLPNSFRHSSFDAEFYAAYRAIKDNGIDNMSINLYCDHEGVCSILKSRKFKRPWRYPHVSDFLTELLSWMDSKNISLSVLWIPSESNPADSLSRSALGLDQDLIDSIVELIKLSRLMDVHNKQDE